MRKLVLLVGFMIITSAYFNLTSCSKDEDEDEETGIVSHEYSDWMEMTETDSVLYAKARAAFLDDPANAKSPHYLLLKSLSGNPYAVRTQIAATREGINYQFAFPEIVVTVYIGNDDEVGKVIMIEAGLDLFPGPIPPDPRKRDTLIY